MWDKRFRRKLKEYLLYEGKTPEIDALLLNVDNILAQLPVRTKKAQGKVAVARHNINQIRKKYKREKAELYELRELREQDE